MAYVLEEMTWPAVEDALDETRLVVVPTASIEQHGPHLPLAVDTIRARELGRRIADRLDCFVAPTVRPGRSDHHMAFPGTISLAEETFRSVVRDYCESLVAHGFEHIALFTSHGGNTASIEALAPELDADLDANVFVAGDREGMMAARTGAMAEFGVSPEEAGAHAGAAETAFVMETDPDLVHDTAGTTGFVGDIDEAEADVADGLDALTDNGVLGDPEQADPEQGEELIERCAAYLADEIQQETERLEAA
ncbi:creatininase family protein [Halospeciosus flavus]|uniref:Creatininase family protein n=1 Tax=Halospeciosus flavus TaxID=3032283 RepID=A0ABD5Z4D6_9EURY|nr:creatininase family protein [Halospeciosus flavus]